MSGSAGAYTPLTPGVARAAGGGTGAVAGRRAERPRRPAPVPVLPSQRQGTSMADEWPLQDFIEFGALPGAVPCARLRTRNLLWEWRLTKFSERAELIVSELFTNAVKASQALEWPSPVRMWLLSDRQQLLILVWDANPKPAVRMDASAQDVAGRGLALVDAVSREWGSYLPAGMAGKIVWSLVGSEESRY
jgi:Histidine kinase-like ATPase domain